MPIVELKVPNIGDFENVEVIEVLVKVGDRVAKEQPVITLESEKATMEVPAEAAGVVKELKVRQGGKVSEGDVILLLETGGEKKPKEEPAAKKEQKGQEEKPKPETKIPSPLRGGGADTASRSVGAGGAAPARAPAPTVPDTVSHAQDQGGGEPVPASSPPSPPSPLQGEGVSSPAAPVVATPTGVHASPAVRLFARELGVDLSRVTGSGPKNRILKEDVQGFVKKVMTSGPPAAAPTVAGSGLPQMPVIDFAKFGAIEVVPLARIRKLSAQNLHRNWVLVPHVTQFDQADITELEEFRKEQKTEADRRGVKLTMLAFLLKACANTLLKFPELNSSLAPDGEKLILKKYVNIGVAVDTPNGLVVPVIREVDKKGIYQLAGESAAVAEKARAGKLSPADMQGGCFSISSLGGIGGTAFTPIVNAPEVAILGVSKSGMQPVWDNRAKAFLPRLLLPLSLSYDHRVIDGAQAARITGYLAGLLSDIRRALL